MKIPKTIGLVAVAAVALAALVGAGSAQATPTTLCKTNAVSPFCESGDRYASETAIESNATANVNITMTAFGINVNVKCGTSALTAKTTAQSGTPLPLDVTAWTLAGCGTNAKMNNCSATTEEVGKGGSLTWTSGVNGTAVLYGSKQVDKWRLKCNMGILGNIDCKYSFKPTVTFQGGSPAQLAVPAMSPSSQEAGEGVCGAKTMFEAVNYSVSTPSPAYPAKAEARPPGTQLCKAKNENPCSEGNLYPEGTLLKAKSENPYISTYTGGVNAKVSCKEASLGLETKAAIGYPSLPIEMTEFQLSGCYWPLFGNCTVTTTFPKPTGTLQYLGGAYGQFGGAGDLRQNWNFICSSGGSKYECTLGGGLTPGGIFSDTEHFAYGEPAKIDINGVQIEHEGEKCPESASLVASFTVTSPSPLYVTQK